MWYNPIMKQTQTQTEAQVFSATIEKAARSLHNSIRYIYAVSMGDFYNVNVKDLFKLSLTDISSPNILSNLGLSPSDDFRGDLKEFSKLADLMFYAFAVRLPYLRRRVVSPKYNDRFLRDLYEACLTAGASDPSNIVQEDFKSNMKLAKSAKAPEPPFSGEWFRRWVYSCGGELAAITNRNMFLLGCMDALLPLYYAKLTDILAEQLK